MDYARVVIKQYPKLKDPTLNTPESSYWRKFNKQIRHSSIAAVTNIDFCTVEPYSFAVTSSTRVEIFDPQSLQEPSKTISRFKDVAYCGTFRNDGKLLVAGSADGLIQVFDMASRSVLRQFRGHTAYAFMHSYFYSQ